MSGDAEPIVFHRRKSSAIWLLLSSVLFVVLGIWIAQTIGWGGYLVAGFFSLGIPVAVVQLLPGSTYLRITENELTFTIMFRETSISWDVIDEFMVITMKQTGMTIHKMVGINFVSSYDGSRLGRRVSSALSGCDGALPDTYGQRAEDLADLLNACLQEFTDRSGEQTVRAEQE